MIVPYRNEAQRQALNQIKMLLDENNVLKPHILWIEGQALILFLQKIGKSAFWKDGEISHGQLYRYNLDTGRFRKAEPIDPSRKRLS